VDRKKAFDRLDLKNQRPIDNDVQSITALEIDCFVANRQRYLALKRNARLLKFVTETLLIGGFEQSGSKFTMNIDCKAYHLGRP